LKITPSRTRNDNAAALQKKKLCNLSCEGDKQSHTAVIHVQFDKEAEHVNIAVCYARNIVFKIKITDDKNFGIIHN
jgi:hypothetical protein